MFDTLDDRIKHDDQVEISTKERVVKGVAIAIISVLLFGGLYFAVRMLE